MRVLLISMLILPYNVLSQGCCAGGANNPIAGGIATGVLLENQIEISINHQLNKSKKFFSENKDVAALFDNLNSRYLFLKADYGVSKKLTVSLAAGYFLNKSQVGINQSNTISSKGFSDLIFFPRYSIYNKTKDSKRTEIVFGLGIKVPLGSHVDSNETIPGVWDINPQITQTTTGANDLILYTFLYREYKKQKMRVFLNSLHINNGFNSLGVRYGNYSSIGIFVSKTLHKRWSLTTQLKAEWIKKMILGKVVDNLESWRADVWKYKQENTGSKKIFLIPQISYSRKNITIFTTMDIPLYQNLNGIQIGSQHQMTLGINYRFLVKDCDDASLLPNLSK